MTQVSSTNLYHTWGVYSRPKWSSFKMFHVLVGKYETDGWAHGHSFNLFIDFILKGKVSIV